MQKMALVSIRLKHVAWRNGRPRFSPGPDLRRLGCKGEDLKRPDGSWMDLGAAEAWVQAKDAEIEAMRRDRPLAPPVAGSRKIYLYTVGDLFDDWFRSPRFKPEAAEGRRQRKLLAENTVAEYGHKASVLERYDPDLWGAAIDILTPPEGRFILFGLYEKLWRDRGLATARGVIAVLSSAIAWGMRTGKCKFTVNPCQKLGMETPMPRIRVGEIFEMRALVAAADSLRRPEIGDAIVLGLWTGQRQSDRLALTDEGLANGRRIFRQRKTGAIVAIREAPELEARLAAMRERRKDWKIVDQKPALVMDERTRKPFRRDWYRHLFAEIRAAAVAAGCASLANFRDQDLRDTAVTWMALGGSTIPEIIAVTGHSPGTATEILKHYLARHPELADAAIGKMIAWYEGKASG